MPKIRFKEGVGGGEDFVESMNGVFRGEVFVRFVFHS